MAWTINEIYTNADGTVQFIELISDGSVGDDNLVGKTITSTAAGSGSDIFTIPNPDGITGSTTGKTLLFATQAFADLGIATVDYIIPASFLPIFDAPPGPGGEDGTGGTLEVFGQDTLTFLSLPKDGALSTDGNGVLQFNSPQGFTDTIPGSVPGPNGVEGTSGPETLVGTAGNDVILARAGNDTLDGGAGNDTLRGQAGDDQYVVSEAGDKVIENSNAGTDIVLSSVDFTLGNNVENLTLTGTAVTGSGNALDNVINGNGQNNTLAGFDGNDTLFGSSGTDSLDGGNGNDSIWGGDDNDLIQGNVGNDTVQGNAGDDFVRGALGNDEVRGGQGNDTVQGGAGDDVIRGALGNDEMRGGLDNDQLFGGQNNDTLFGGQGNDTLQGLLNDDVLQGLLGNDQLTGGGGLDQFWFHSAGPANVDTITDFDFNGEADTIVLQQLLGFFTQLSLGSVAAGNFVANAGATAGDGNDYLLYDTNTGNLWYDADGNGVGGALQIATLTGAPGTLAATDFLIVA